MVEGCVEAIFVQGSMFNVDGSPRFKPWAAGNKPWAVFPHLLNFTFCIFTSIPSSKSEDFAFPQN